MGRVLAKDRVLDLLVDKAEYDEKFETYYTFIRQVDIADELDIVAMTVNRSVKQLQEEGKIDYVTKSGRYKSGHVVTFNMDEIEINPDNPLTGKSVKAQAIYEEYFEPTPYEPKRKYRTKKQIAEDELKKTEEQKRYDRMNDELEGLAFVPKSFFRGLKNSETAYKGYILSRLYNAMLVSYTEDWKNVAERYNNEAYYKRANFFYNKYRNYDIIGKRFMGTTTFRKFAELSIMLDRLKIDPEEYLSVNFNRMFYNLKRGNTAHPPHINNLTSQGGLDIYKQQVAYKASFDKEHPYYSRPGKVRMTHTEYPILSALKEEFHRGLEKDVDYVNTKVKVEDLEQDLVAINDFGLYNYPKSDVMTLTFDAIRNDANYNDLTDDEKQSLTDYVNRNILLFKDRSRPTAEYIKYFTPTIRYLTDKLYNERKEVNQRGYFLAIGNLEQEKDISILEGQKFIEDGYKYYFSMRGSSTFFPAVRTMVDDTYAELSYRQVREALSKLEIEVPINESGLIDINKLMEQVVKEHPVIGEHEAVDSQRKIKETVKFFETEDVDNDSTYWYKIYEPQGRTGQHPRDGLIK